MKTLLIIFVTLCVFYSGITTADALSNREGKKGLFADLSISIDGVTVRRFRDVDAGTLCYVASTPANGIYWGTQPAISCVGWQP